MDKFNKMLAAAEPIILSVFRIIVGLLLFQYGVAKILQISGTALFRQSAAADLHRRRDRTGAGRAADPRTADAAGGVHPVRRDGVRLFHRAFPKGFFPLINGGSGAILFCFACLYLFFAGGGPLSLDAMMRKKS